MQAETQQRRVLIIQNGDYRDAYTRFAAGKAERYRDQKRSVDFVASLTGDGPVTTVAFGPEAYREELAPDLWAQGIKKNPDRKEIRALFDVTRPTHLVLRTPHRGLLREAIRRDTWVLPSFADIFQPGALDRRLKQALLRRDLMRARAPCVANHSLNASRSLIDVLGLPADRVVPWDWSRVPLGGPPKTGPADSARPTAFFAGSLTQAKGVGDCLDALSILASKGQDLQMAFAGPGDLAPWRARADALGVTEQVTFLGQISNADVRAEMRARDFVIVPSRRSYPEGLPNTIYEALASRSVLILSDHPAFAGRLAPDKEALVFSAGDPEALATCLARAIRTPALCQALSEASEAAHDALYLGLEWSALVTAFLDDPGNSTGWVARHACLASMQEMP